VTVVIPCHNHGRYLGEAVASALDQEGGAPQVIVVDDGSTETETEAALAALPDSVEAIRQANAGPAAARNAGFELAETPLVMPLDADDRLPPDAVAALQAGLEGDRAAAYAYGTMRFFGDWSGEVRFPPYDPYRLLYRPIVGWLGLIRREDWEQVGGFDPSLTGFEDWDFTLAMAARGRHGHRLDRVVLEYRKHDRSGLEGDRRRYRELYRRLRAKHAELFERAPQLAADSDLGPAGRLAYRAWWAWRPLPASAERALFGLHFRGGRG
jgi:glycosyltransferase involved in cell wall biosynthesis